MATFDRSALVITTQNPVETQTFIPPSGNRLVSVDLGVASQSGATGPLAFNHAALSTSVGSFLRPALNLLNSSLAGLGPSFLWPLRLSLVYLGSLMCPLLCFFRLSLHPHRVSRRVRHELTHCWPLDRFCNLDLQCRTLIHHPRLGRFSFLWGLFLTPLYSMMSRRIWMPPTTCCRVFILTLEYVETITTPAPSTPLDLHSYYHILSIVLADLGKSELLVHDLPKPRSFWELDQEVQLKSGAEFLNFDQAMVTELTKAFKAPSTTLKVMNAFPPTRCQWICIQPCLSLLKWRKLSNRSVISIPWPLILISAEFWRYSMRRQWRPGVLVGLWRY